MDKEPCPNTKADAHEGDPQKVRNCNRIDHSGKLLSGLAPASQAVRSITGEIGSPKIPNATAWAPVNIALIKYWGKRNEELHLPVTDSLSISLSVGTTTTLSQAASCDEIQLNGQSIPPSSPFHSRTVAFLDLFRPAPNFFFSVQTANDIPTAAGLASSASGFAALVQALNLLFGWDLPKEHLSILARLGSGSAARSLYPGFVRWYAGTQEDGSDSYAIPLEHSWDELRLGILLLSSAEKQIGSTLAMRQTVATSPIYRLWPTCIAQAMKKIVEAISTRDFATFGEIVEHNAMLMHASMHTAWPPICYWNEETLRAMKAIWEARSSGLPIFFTMDAGPNIKVLYRACDEAQILRGFDSLWKIPLQFKGD